MNKKKTSRVLLGTLALIAGVFLLVWAAFRLIALWNGNSNTATPTPQSAHESLFGSWDIATVLLGVVLLYGVLLVIFMFLRTFTKRSGKKIANGDNHFLFKFVLFAAVINTAIFIAVPAGPSAVVRLVRSLPSALGPEKDHVMKNVDDLWCGDQCTKEESWKPDPEPRQWPAGTICLFSWFLVLLAIGEDILLAIGRAARKTADIINKRREERAQHPPSAPSAPSGTPAPTTPPMSLGKMFRYEILAEILGGFLEHFVEEFLGVVAHKFHGGAPA